jgi:uncharacterized protein YjbI with pentapeptide repeats
MKYGRNDHKRGYLEILVLRGSIFAPLIMRLFRLREWFDALRKRSGQFGCGILGILLLIAVGSTGWSLSRTGDWDGLALNFGTELAGAIVTYLLIEIAIGTRRRKESLIAQLTSKSVDVAINAIEEIIRNGWHLDGSLKNIHLPGVNLPGVELNSVNFENSVLAQGNFQGARLFSANMQWAIISQVDFSNADLSFANLSNTNMTMSVLPGAKLLHASLIGAHMEVTNWQGADLQNANLQGADLFGADLRGANLKDANLQDALLKDAKYDSQTTFPTGFNPVDAGMIKDKIILF